MNLGVRSVVVVACWAALGAGVERAAAQVEQACCLPDGGCEDGVPMDVCQQLNGVPLGAGSQCGPPGACCFVGAIVGECTAASTACCVVLGGIPQGNVAACTQPTACCLGSDVCVEVDRLCCDDLGGVAMGLDLSCSDVDCGGGPECGPTPDGTGCVDVQCDSSNEVCRPSALSCNPNGVCLVADCTCGPPDACRITPNPAGGPPVCTGVCAEGTACVRFEEDTDGDGIVDLFYCECVPNEPQCMPTADGGACSDVACPGEGQECVPVRVRCVPGGSCSIVECACRHPGVCHIALDHPGAPLCVGECPPGMTCQQQVIVHPGGVQVHFCECLPLGGCGPTPEGDACNDEQCPVPSQECLPTRVLCTASGSECRVLDCECRDPEVCHIALDPPATLSCDGVCPPGFDCVQRIEQLPQGQTVHVCECVPPGEKCCLPEGECAVLPPGQCEEMGGEPLGAGECGEPKPCCFVGDVTAFCVETDPECCELFGGIVQDGNQGCSEPQACCLSATACFDVDPLCCDELGGVPQGPGTNCDNTSCDDSCMPTADGFACSDVACPEPGQECVPVAAQCEPNGLCRIVECACRNPDVCHAVFTPGGPPLCQGVCPPGADCVRIEEDTNGDGAPDLFICACEAAACEPAPGGLTCSDVACPEPGQECVPTAVTCVGAACEISECACRDPELCHVNLVHPGSLPFCSGECPEGTSCELHTIFPPDGTAVSFCECVEAECAPAPDLQSCQQVECPEPNNVCVPTKVICGPAGAGCVIEECECRNPQACHVELDIEPFCVGVCPTGIDCEEIVTILPTDQTLHECVCQPPTQGCCLPQGCQDLLPPVCVDLGGAPLGPGTQCLPPEACCLETPVDFGCIEIDRRCCDLFGGTPQGPVLGCSQPRACCLPEGECIEVDPVCCDDLGGIPLDIASCNAADCPKRPRIVHELSSTALTTPCSGYVDPHVEVLSAPVGMGPGGVREVFIKFNVEVFHCGGGPVTPADFSLSETGGAIPPTVTAVNYVGPDLSRVHVVFSRPPTPREWTTLKADVCNAIGFAIENVGDLGDPCPFPPGPVCNEFMVFAPAFAEPDRIDLGRLPADVDQNRVVQPLDLLRYRQFVAGICDELPPPVCPDCGGAALFYNIDQDPAQTISPLDLLRLRQSILGTAPAATMPWGGQTMNNPRP